MQILLEIRIKSENDVLFGNIYHIINQHKLRAHTVESVQGDFTLRRLNSIQAVSQHILTASHTDLATC